MVGAVAMIVGALVVRGRLDDENVDAGQVYRLVCAADLDRVCADLDDAFPGRVDVTVEGAGATADRLRRLDGDPELDGWLVADPWPALVDEARRAGSLPPLFATEAAPLARSPLVIVAWKDRAAALARRVPAARWGGSAWAMPPADPSAKVGHADAARDGIGPARAGPGHRRVVRRPHRPVDVRPRRRGLPAVVRRARAADGVGRHLAPRPDAPHRAGRLRLRRDHRGRRDQGRHRRQTGRAHQDLPFVHGDRRRGPGRHPRRPGGSPARDRRRPGPDRADRRRLEGSGKPPASPPATGCPTPA